MNEHLAKKFCPIVYFHSDERYYPCSIEEYLKHCELWYKGIRLYKEGQIEELTPKYAQAQTLDNRRKWHLETQFKNKKFNRRAPCYAKIDKDTTNRLIYITYIFFYAYNHGYGYKIRFNNYYGDFQYIIVKISEIDGTILQIFYKYNIFKSGKWIVDFKSKHGKPIVYVSKYTHHHYWTNGDSYYLLGLLTDKCNKGKQWKPNVKIISKEETPWIIYYGTWDNRRSRSIVEREWWNLEL